MKLYDLDAPLKHDFLISHVIHCLDYVLYHIAAYLCTSSEPAVHPPVLKAYLPIVDKWRFQECYLHRPLVVGKTDIYEFRFPFLELFLIRSKEILLGKPSSDRSSRNGVIHVKVCAAVITNRGFCEIIIFTLRTEHNDSITMIV